MPSSPTEQEPALTAEPPSPAAVRVAVLTPPGRGAVATISVTGPQAAQLVAANYRPAAGRPLTASPVGRIIFGRWCPDQTPGDEVVVCRRGDDEVEVHCHGGRLAAGAIVSSLVAAGAVEIPWSEFIASREPGGLEAAARVALAAVRTERAAAILLDQWRGELRAALSCAAAGIQGEASADAATILQGLIRSARVGLHLVEPWQVVLTGRPNVGKSSLLNAILGYERCIVHASPGTTRDVVTAQTALAGWPVELADTAGWRKSGDEIEAAGLAQAQTQLRQADLVVLVFDVTAGWTGEDQTLLAAWPEAVVVHNKCDLPAADAPDRPPGLRVSATQRQGLDELVRELSQRLVPEPPPPGSAVLFRREQLQGVQAASTALAAGDEPQAVAVLHRLLAD